ncbi:MAG: hypothetical protein WAN14_00650 [Candidatus Acidiferrales bacterium]
MSCTSCASENQRKFGAEVNIHHLSLKNLNRQDVMVFTELVVCLDCGCSQLTIPKIKLALAQALQRALTPELARVFSHLPRAVVISLSGIEIQGYTDGVGSMPSIRSAYGKLAFGLQELPGSIRLFYDP